MAQKGRKPKGALKTSDDVKTLITDTYKKHRDWSAAKLREIIIPICKAKGWRCPSRPTVGNKIREVEKKLADPRRELWGLASVSKYPEYFPSDVIPLLLKMQYGDLDEAFRKANPSPDWRDRNRIIPEDTRQMTVWTAIWVARLYKIPGMMTDDLRFLRRVSLEYAICEETQEVAGIDKPVDTYCLDSADVEIMSQKLGHYFADKIVMFKNEKLIEI